MASAIMTPVMCEVYNASPRGLFGSSDVLPCMPLGMNPFLDTDRLRFGDLQGFFTRRRNPFVQGSPSFAGFVDEIVNDFIADDYEMDSDEEEAECFCPRCEEECCQRKSSMKPDEYPEHKKQDDATFGCDKHDDSTGSCTADTKDVELTDEPSEESKNKGTVAVKESPEKFHLQFNLNGFAPHEISVKTKDDQYIEVRAKHQETSENGRLYQEFYQVLPVPGHVDPQSITSAFSTDGQLKVQASLKSDTEEVLEVTHQ